MHVIADSSHSRTLWAIVDGDRKIECAQTRGLDPFQLSRREISHVIRLELPQVFFRRRWEHVYFYGTGCSNADKKQTVQSSLIAQFKTPAIVESNLLGAARGLLGTRPGLVAMLGVGANSCFYDGVEIAKNVRSGGYILGDEGSKSYLGKVMVADILKGVAPEGFASAFFRHYNTNADEVMDLVYTHPQAGLTLAQYSDFLASNIHDSYCRDTVYNGFMNFFKRNIAQYDYRSMPISVVGMSACTYRDILEQAAVDFGVKIECIVLDVLDGIIKFHSNTNTLT